MSTNPRRARRGRPRSRMRVSWLAMVRAGLLIGVLIGALAGGALAQEQSEAEGEIVFRHALDNQPIQFGYRPDQEITPAVEQFHQTAENAYLGDEAATDDGEDLYAKLCQACHLKDGTGRIGPSLVDGEGARARTGTPIGEFEIIYAGGAGAMQAFGQRIDQDQILRIMAYLEVLKAEAPSK